MSASNGDDPAGTGAKRTAGPPEPTVPARPLTPGEALMKLFMDNADNGRNAANDELIDALRQRAREIQALADLPGARITRDAGPEMRR